MVTEIVESKPWIRPTVASYDMNTLKNKRNGISTLYISFLYLQVNNF